MDCEIDPDSWQVIHTDEPDKTKNLVQILKAASEIRGDTEWLKGKEVVSEVEFDIEWGLGLILFASPGQCPGDRVMT